METIKTTKVKDESTNFFKQEEHSQRFYPFYLSEDFIKSYAKKKPPWGPLGEFTFLRTYSRWIYSENGSKRKEKWHETVKRVVEGTFTIQKKHCFVHKVPWNNIKAQSSAKIMFDLIFNMKFLPPGRGLWMMGGEYIEKRGSTALNNCFFVSTKNMSIDPITPFKVLMDMSMLGVGVGFNTNGAGSITIKKPIYIKEIAVIPDTREGWVEAVSIVLSGFFHGSKIPEFDYSKIRKKGEPIKGFGGEASGPEPLIELIDCLKKLYSKRIGKPIRSTDIVDTSCMIGRCVVSGNVRRSALISLGDSGDTRFLDLKDYNKHPNENGDDGWRWASNNSIYAIVGQDYSDVAKRTAINGEPGYVWLDNIRKYGRMSDPINNADYKAEGCNPCFGGEEELSVLSEDGECRRTFESLDGKTVRVVTPNRIVDGKVWCSGEKDTIELSTVNNGKTIVTPDHIFMTSEGDEIQAKDTLGCRLRIHSEQIKHDNHYVKLGFIQGDASLCMLYQNHRHKGFEINIGQNDGDVRDLFGFPHDGHRKYYTTGFFDECIDLGFSSDPLPYRKLPTKIPIDKIESFLRGLFSANGSVIKDTRVTLKSTCKGMIDQVSELLERICGINSYVTTNKTKEVKFSNGNHLCEESYDLNISDIFSIAKFYSKIGFIHNYKMEKLIDLLEKKSPKVISIKDSGKRKVYDFSAPGINWGFVNGYVVHNCGEQSLENMELCCLVETFPSLHDSFDEYKLTLKYAYLYAKTVTLIPTHWQETNAVMLRNRRIGTSQSGVIDSFAKHGRSVMLDWSDNGYEYLKKMDNIYSDWLCIPRSIKITSIKPSGTVSLLPGVSPGIHYPHSQFYIRRIRVASDSPLVDIMKNAGYNVELDVKRKESTSVIEFPVKTENFTKGKNEITIWEQFLNASDYQKYWSDNQVSITITFKEEESRDIETALSIFDNSLKSVSLLPSYDSSYPQMPYEEISEDTYNEMVSKLSKPDFRGFTDDAAGEKFCDGDNCVI